MNTTRRNPFAGEDRRRLKNQRARPRWLAAILGVSLETKLLGANVIVVAVAGFLLFSPVSFLPGSSTAAYVAAALVLGLVVDVVLVRIALRPIDALERVADRVSGGGLGDRVPSSIVADDELARLSTTINQLLDRRAADRERMAELGEEVIYAREGERARVAGELEESVGQILATAAFELDTAAYEIGTHKATPRLARTRELLRAATENIRKVTRSLHPRIAAVHLLASNGTDDFAETRRPVMSTIDRVDVSPRQDVRYITLGSQSVGRR